MPKPLRAALFAVILIGVILFAIKPWRDRSRPDALTRESGADEGPTISFRISNIRTQDPPADRTASGAPPTPWTAFDCTPDSDSTASFTVAVPPSGATASSKIPASFAQAVISVPDRDHGDRLVRLFASTFQTAPPPARKPQPIAPLHIDTAVLGTNLDQSLGGSASGNWTATKWFLQNDGFDAEVFFNFDLVAGRGVFAEKDPDYAPDLVGSLAAALRDGPRPIRTPADDSNLTTAGPTITDLHPLAAANGRHVSFFPNDQILFIDSNFRDSVAYILDPQSPDKRIEIGKFQGRLNDIYPLDPQANRYVAVESIPADPHIYSSADPTNLWLVDRLLNKQTKIEGPWESSATTSAKSPSPDGRIFAIKSYKKSKAFKEDPRQQLHFVDLASLRSTTIGLPDGGEIEKWTGNDARLRAVVRTGNSFDNHALRQLLSVDPSTGTVEQLSDGNLPLDENSMDSPDGKQRLKLTPKLKLDIKDLGSGSNRTFLFHEDDQRFAVEGQLQWLTPRYILFRALRPSLIDTTEMHMNYPTSEPTSDITFSPDLGWALVTTPTGISIGKVRNN